MTNVKVHSMTKDGLTSHMNEGIDSFMKAMVIEGVITEEQKTEMTQYRVVVTEETIWGRFWDLLTGKTEAERDSDRLYVVKVIQ